MHQVINQLSLNANEKYLIQSAALMFDSTFGADCRQSSVQNPCTRVYIHAIFRPHWWISVGRDVYLEDAVSGTCYKLKRSEGIELNKETYMPDSGMMDFVLEFEPLAKGTETIHMKSPDDSEGNTYDISLVPEKKKQQQPIERIRGNHRRLSPLGIRRI